jgi:hypothetical protein
VLCAVESQGAPTVSDLAVLDLSKKEIRYPSDWSNLGIFDSEILVKLNHVLTEDLGRQKSNNYASPKLPQATTGQRSTCANTPNSLAINGPSSPKVEPSHHTFSSMQYFLQDSSYGYGYEDALEVYHDPNPVPVAEPATLKTSNLSNAKCLKMTELVRERVNRLVELCALCETQPVLNLSENDKSFLSSPFVLEFRKCSSMLRIRLQGDR